MVGWGAYARDKNTSARLYAKSAGGLMHEGEGGVFAGHYSNCSKVGRFGLQVSMVIDGGVHT